jgi:hypothetical protein
MKRLSLLLCFAVLLFSQARAQYADGTGSGSMQKQIFWLTWGSGVTPSVAGAKIDNGTYTWYISPTIKVQAILSNIVGESYDSHVVTMAKYTTGSWSSSTEGLQHLYPGINPMGMATSLDGGLAPASVGGHTITFDIEFKLYLLISGVWTSVTYPGIVIGDAESLASSAAEHIIATTNASVAWQVIDFRTIASATESAKYKLDISSSGKQFKIYMGSSGDIGAQAVMFARNATKLTGVQMKGGGITAMAMGFVVPFDFGDAPATYGDAGNYMNNFSYTDGTVSADGTYAPYTLSKSVLLPAAKVYMGANDVDADGNPPHSILANADGADDSGAVFPSAIKVNQDGNVVVKVKATNPETAKAATIYAWIDFNRDGKFAANELQTATVPASTVNTEYTFTYAKSSFTSNIKAGTSYARLRITTYPVADSTGSTDVDERSFTVMGDGETEDYMVDIAGVTISGTVYNDGNGTTDNSISGTGIGKAGTTQLYAYLVDATTGLILQKDTVNTDGTYLFNQYINNGNYKVVISTSNGTVGAAQSTIPANLPAAWAAVGESYGTNNLAGSGIETGNPNLEIAVTTPAGGLDISSVNFALDRRPTSTAGSYTIPRPVSGALKSVHGGSSMGALKGSDPEDQPTVGHLSGKSLTIVDTTGMNGNKLYYDGVLLVNGSVINNYDSTKLTILFSGKNSTSARFTFSYRDAAGVTSATPAAFAISWPTPLPLELMSFNANLQQNSVLLDWQTAQEVNIASFRVLRSLNGTDWSELATQKAGALNGLYQYQDQHPISGTNYYRLQIMELDGTFSYAPTQLIRYQWSSAGQIELYPNPANESVYIQNYSGRTISAINVYDVMGKKVMAVTGSASTLSCANWLPGAYYICMMLDNGELVKLNFTRSGN